MESALQRGSLSARKIIDSALRDYCTLFHELAHSTGHAKRLHRDSFDNPVLIHTKRVLPHPSPM